MGFRIVLGIVILAICYVVYSAIALSLRYERLIDVSAERIIGTQDDTHIDVVAFFDYTDPKTREIDGAIRAAVSDDPAAYYIPYPIYDPNRERSQDYALYFYLAGQQGLYIPMHDALLARSGAAIESEEEIITLLSEAGLDIEKAAEQGAAQDDTIATYDLFRALGGRSLPTLIINRKIFYSPPAGDMLTADLVKKLIERVREPPQ